MSHEMNDSTANGKDSEPFVRSIEYRSGDKVEDLSLGSLEVGEDNIDGDSYFFSLWYQISISLTALTTKTDGRELRVTLRFSPDPSTVSEPRSTLKINMRLESGGKVPGVASINVVNPQEVVPSTEVSPRAPSTRQEPQIQSNPSRDNSVPFFNSEDHLDWPDEFGSGIENDSRQTGSAKVEEVDTPRAGTTSLPSDGSRSGVAFYGQYPDVVLSRSSRRLDSFMADLDSPVTSNNNSTPNDLSQYRSRGVSDFLRSPRRGSTEEPFQQGTLRQRLDTQQPGRGEPLQRAGGGAEGSKKPAPTVQDVADVESVTDELGMGYSYTLR